MEGYYNGSFVYSGLGEPKKLARTGGKSVTAVTLERLLTYLFKIPDKIGDRKDVEQTLGIVPVIYCILWCMNDARYLSETRVRTC